MAMPVCAQQGGFLCLEDGRHLLMGNLEVKEATTPDNSTIMPRIDFSVSGWLQEEVSLGTLVGFRMECGITRFRLHNTLVVTRCQRVHPAALLFLVEATTRPDKIMEACGRWEPAPQPVPLGGLGGIYRCSALTALQEHPVWDWTQQAEVAPDAVVVER